MAKKDRGVLTGKPVTYQIPSPAGGVRMETFIPWTLVKRGIKKQVITPLDTPERFQEEAAVEAKQRNEAKETPLLRALGLAHYWQQLLDDGKFRSITEIAAAEGMDVGQASRLGKLVRLAPNIVEECLAGKESKLMLGRLVRRRTTIDWGLQRAQSL